MFFLTLPNLPICSYCSTPAHPHSVDMEHIDEVAPVGPDSPFIVLNCNNIHPSFFCLALALQLSLLMLSGPPTGLQSWPLAKQKESHGDPKLTSPWAF